MKFRLPFDDWLLLWSLVTLFLAYVVQPLEFQFSCVSLLLLGLAVSFWVKRRRQERKKNLDE